MQVIEPGQLSESTVAANSALSGKIAFLCNPGMDTFLPDITSHLGESHKIRIVSSGDNAEVNVAVKWADLIWVEWANELAVAVSRGLPPGINKRVICRLHSYEAFAGFLEQMKWERIDDLIFVADHIREYVVERVPGLERRVQRTHVIPNGVDPERLSFKERSPGRNLAYLGYINHKKGPMLLIHAFADLVRQDPNYHLFIGGRFQDERYPLYFEHMIRELGLEKNVSIDGWVDDVPGWLEDKQYIVCSSVLESQGLGIMEAMACGVKPIIHNFVGARSIYNDSYLWNSIPEFSQMVLSEDYDSAAYRQFVAERYSLTQQLGSTDRLVNTALAEILSPVSTA